MTWPCHWPSRRDIFLSTDSKLTTVPSLQGLSALQELHLLNDSKLTTVPSLQGLSALQELYLRNDSKLTTLPSSLPSQLQVIR